MGINPEILSQLRGLRKDAQTTGFSIGTGLNYYNLEPQALRLYPIFHPLLDSIPRPPSGGGNAVNWKALTAFDTINGAGYPMTSEGNRGAVFNVQEKNYTAAYKFMGKEGFVTFQAQLAARKFDDLIGVQNIMRLEALLVQEDNMMLWGNSGPNGTTGGNGFALGTAGTPVLTLATGTGLPGATAVTVFVVALTGYGVQSSSVAGGLLGTFTRTNADGSQDTINGGSGIISAASNTVTTTGSTLNVVATAPASRGAMGYAWYVNVTDATKANAKLYAITSAPVCTISSTPGATQAASAAILTTDYSYNSLDFDGLITWNTAGGGYWSDLGGGGLTSNGDGTIYEFEQVMAYLWKNYKIGVNTIWLGGTMQRVVSRAILGSGTTGQSQRIVFDTDQTGRLKGGTLAVSYRNPYVSGTYLPQDLDIRTHPNLPDGTIFFDLTTNPYPDSNVGNVREFETMQDHFSINWPLRSLKYEYGTYCFGTLKHYIPFGTGLLTGVGHSVNIPGGTTVAA